jgi:phosphatidylserine/phosphatidylglycerophosphate/cardiolipin synthase-like enzyme
MSPLGGEENASVDIVITGPQALTSELAYKTGCRTTMGVITQLFAQARDRVIVSVPYLQPGYGLLAGPVHDALLSALGRGVTVNVMSNAKSIKLLRDTCDPARGHKQFHFFRPRANIEDVRRIGSHAKICIADGQAAYIGSANFTGPGLSDQIEIGLLVQGDAAIRVEQFCVYCIESGLFVQTLE